MPGKTGHTEALENFTKVAELEPNSIDAHFNLAAALLGHGQFEKAADHYRKVLSLDPNDAEARKGLEAAIAAQNKTKVAAYSLGKSENACDTARCVSFRPRIFIAAL